MTAILFLTRYITIDHPLFFSRNQFTHPCNGSETEVREDSRRSQGFLSGRALRLIGSAAKSSGGPPRDRQAQLITPAPPQRDRTQGSGRPQGHSPGPLCRARHTHACQEGHYQRQKPVGPGEDPKSLPSRVPSP
jgi:hypothetical protein